VGCEQVKLVSKFQKIVELLLVDEIGEEIHVVVDREDGSRQV
jgi:hypothetical protein